MIRLLRTFIVIVSFCIPVNAQDFVSIPEDRDSFNLYNDRQQKHGFWSYPARESLDGFTYNEYGFYINGRKEGKWVKHDRLGRLIAVEHFTKNVLNGECYYYNKGALTLIARFRGLNQDIPFDTILVVNPVDLEETEVIVPTDIGSTRHGTWKYYNPMTGAVIRVEEYQVDSLINSFDYYISEKEDKESIEKMMKEMPHNFSDNKIRTINRKYRKSLIR